MKQCGIYKISNENGKVYVGQSKDISRRLARHRNMLTHNKHKNTHLQNSWNKNSNFKFEILEICPSEDLNIREIYWIRELQSMNPGFGFNRHEGGLGGALTGEALVRMSKSLTGRNLSEDHRNKISSALTGVSRPEDVKAKISLSKSGETKSKEHRNKISNALSGRKLSEETKVRMSLSKKNLKQDKVSCPHCGKSGGNAMYRWHFEKCTNKSL